MKKFYNNLESLEVLSKVDNNKLVVLNRLVDNISIPKRSVNSEFDEVIKNVVGNFEYAISNWKKQIQKIVAEYEFNRYLENKFIVIVYGKVNAGKSSLGNFVANNEIVNNMDKKAKFFVYESNDKKQIKELEEFKTNNLECTSAIQGFEINSLAWIDTPGLLSMTKQNSELAKKYINAADFIIFPTSSDSPMQKSEIQELKELQKYNKKFHIVITKSDTVEEDEVDGELVKVFQNKSQQVRKLQEEDVKNRLKEEGIEVDNVFSLSVKMAKKGDLKGSNILRFFEFMNDVLLTKADKLKKESQIQRLEGFIQNDILKNIDELYKSINILKEEKNNVLVKIKRKIQTATSDALLLVNNILTPKIEQINKNNIKKELQEVQTDIYTNLEQILIRDINNIFKKFDAEFQEFIHKVNTNKNIEDKYRTVEITTITITKQVATAGGAAAGTILGGMIGGPLGATVGGILGGYAASKMVEDTKTYTKKIKAGDNKIEIIRSFKEDISKAVSKSISEFYYKLETEFISEVEFIIKSLENELEKIKKGLK